MTITAPAPVHTAGARPDPMRSHARVAGIFYLLTFASSIPALLLIAPVLNDAGYVTSAGQRHPRAVGLPARLRERPDRGRLRRRACTRS